MCRGGVDTAAAVSRSQCSTDTGAVTFGQKKYEAYHAEKLTRCDVTVLKQDADLLWGRSMCHSKAEVHVSHAQVLHINGQRSGRKSLVNNNI